MLVDAFLYYLLSVPVIIYSFINLGFLINKAKIEGLYNKDGAQQIIVNNPGAVSNLSHVDIAVFGKTDAIIDPCQKRDVEGIILKDTYYSLKRGGSSSPTRKRKQQKLVSLL